MGIPGVTDTPESLCHKGLRVSNVYPAGVCGCGAPVCYGARMHPGWDPAELSRLIDAIRESSGLTQRKLAVLAKVHHSQITRWKSGEHRPAYDQITRLATALTEGYPDLAEEAAQLPAAAGYGTVTDLRPEIVVQFWRNPVIGAAVRGIWGADPQYVPVAQKLDFITRLARLTDGDGSGDGAGDAPAIDGP